MADHATKYRWKTKWPRNMRTWEIVPQVYKTQWTVNRIIRRVYTHMELVHKATRSTNK